MGLIPGSGRSLEVGNGNPLQYSCLENPVEGGAWWAAVHRVAQSRTRLKQLSMRACIGEGNGNPLQCSCLENPRDGGAWWAAVYGVSQSWTQLKWLSSSSSMSTQSCPALYDPMNFSPPASSVHGIFQVRILEWVAISFSRGSCRPRDRTRVSCIVGRSEEVKWSEPPEKSLKLVLLGLINCSMFLFLSFYKGLFQPQLNQ